MVKMGQKKEKEKNKKDEWKNIALVSDLKCPNFDFYIVIDKLPYGYKNGLKRQQESRSRV